MFYIKLLRFEVNTYIRTLHSNNNQVCDVIVHDETEILSIYFDF